MRQALVVVLCSLAVVPVAGCGDGGGSGPVTCAADPLRCSCASDGDCAASRPRCDSRTSHCVPCLPASDNCGADKHCLFDGTGYTCVAKDVCVESIDCPSVGGISGLCCRGMCADPQNDANHCGACGNACGALSNAQSGCVKGSCGVVQCSGGFGDCDKKPANGCETDVTATVDHCGECGAACKRTANTTVTCAASKCAYQCTADFADCDGNPDNGCETSISTNPKACGGCGNACPVLPNASDVACVAGKCVVGACTVPFTDCNRVAADGCESDVMNDPQNCSGCGKKCPAVANAAAGCKGGICGVGTCNPGFGDCDNNVLNGCEHDLTSDKDHCGGCGMACPAINCVPACQASLCVVQSCNPSFADCDGKVANGCEIDTRNDTRNCGACGNACPVPANATATCSQSKCGIGSCLMGFSDCNRDPKDGCETDIRQVQNCGFCGNACAVPANGVSSCNGGACAIGKCDAGFGDCDMKVANGCESPLAADPINCGRCGAVCPSVLNQAPSCANSKCGVSGCNQGFADCNMNLVDGCEVDTRADARNCGACGNVCPQQAPFCTGGVCNNILKSCLEYAKGGGQKSGVFTIDPDGNGPIVPFKVWCDMDMDGGGWTLALSKKIDDSNPNVNGHSLTWDCMVSSDPPQSPTDDIGTVLGFDKFTAMGPTDMLLMGNKRIIKFMFARPNGVPLVTNYRNLTERACFDALITLDAPNTGTSRTGCAHTNDACVTTDYALWKIHDVGAQGCFHDPTNSHRDTQYCTQGCMKANCAIQCGTWGNCPGGGQSMPANAPNCLFYGGISAAAMPLITNCPMGSQAPWADYTPGNMSGYYNLWVR